MKKKYISQVFPNRIFYNNFYTQKLMRETDIADLAFDYYYNLIDYTILDVRNNSDFQKSHIPGAVSCPNGLISKHNLDITGNVVVYCWGPSCNGATKAASRLLESGFNVKELIGGFEYWNKEGFPIEGNNLNTSIYWDYSSLQE